MTNDAIGVGAWSVPELDALIDSYLIMLRSEIAGEEYNKRRSNIQLQDRINRTHASIEFKLCNLSAVLHEQGMPYIQGYKPRAHYQFALFEQVACRLGEFPRVEIGPISSGQSPEVLVSAEVSMTPDNHATNGGVPLEKSNLEFFSNAVEIERASVGSSGGQESEIESTFLDLLGRLWDRSTGGGDVAYRPSTSSFSALPTAPRPAGVEAACAWFAENVVSSKIPKFLFLAGGPGAGKSDAAGQLVAGYSKIGPAEDGLAHRTYYYQTGDRQTVLINDATIPSDEHAIHPLVEEINELARSKDHLVACVNRGILVEESRGRANKDPWDYSAGDAVVKWLASADIGQVGQIWEVETKDSLDHIRTGYLKLEGDIVAEVVAVFVDVCSLLERTPSTNISFDRKDSLTSGSGYKLLDFEDRAIHSPNIFPAGDLLEQVVRQISSADNSDFDDDWNPVIANIHSLSSPIVQSSILSLLRAAEVVSGQRFTYREIWGAIVRCLVGGLPEVIDRTDINREFHIYATFEGNEISTFQHLQKLAEKRISQSLFGIREDSERQNADIIRNPVTRLTNKIDPMRDALSGHRSDGRDFGWASPVTDAFAGPAAIGRPLTTLLESLATDNPFHKIVSKFDRKIDHAFSELLNSDSINDAIRFEKISWYGAYLGRLYATANGIPAFQREVSLWIESWCIQPNLPKQIGLGMRTLLRPKQEPGESSSSSLIPVFDSRTTPIIGNQLSPKLAVQTGDFEMTTFVDAENIFVVLSEHSKEIARMPLDYALIREATSCSTDHSGMTELTEITAPRLERFRAARLITDQLDNAKYKIVHGLEDHFLTVSERA